MVMVANRRTIPKVSLLDTARLETREESLMYQVTPTGAYVKCDPRKQKEAACHDQVWSGEHQSRCASDNRAGWTEVSSLCVVLAKLQGPLHSLHVEDATNKKCRVKGKRKDKV